MSKILTVLFGDPNKKLLADLRGEVAKINALEPEMEKLSDSELKAKTDAFKKRLKDGEGLDDIVHEAFAVVREAAKRTLGQRHYDVQLIGGLTMYRGQIAEMRTGEGKTLTATTALYVNALREQGAHLITVNDYLARRDAVWMGKVFHFLGLSTACIQQEGGFLFDPNATAEATEGEETDSFQVEDTLLRQVSRKEAYDADITYGTNNQFGFDYLRDNMAPTMDKKVMRELHFCIVDEIDSILIDEARTPLIISAPAEESGDMYYKFADIIRTLKENEDYNIDEKMRSATLTDEGIEKIEKALGIDNLYAVDQGVYQRYADSALRAQANYTRDVHYVVKDGEVTIVDEFTGRLMQGRRFSEGIHQAIEAKERVDIKRESRTMATITFQNFFRMYHKLSGMTGTAATEAEEFASIYDLEVVEIPTNKPIARVDAPDAIFKNEIGKFKAIAKRVKQMQEEGKAVLVGTASVEKNEVLSQVFTAAGVKHEVLNAKNHAREGEIIAQAGRKGAVTIATNMAGRGVDIKLGGNPCTPEEEQQAKDLGGLHVIGTERHDSRRIDNQLRGRSGRQGDPGYTQFFLSMEDSLMRIFGSDRAKGMLDRLGLPDDMPIENKMITKSIEKAQTRVEGHHFDSRKRLLEYDDVLNKHREVIYARRDEVLETYADTPDKLRDRVLDVIEGEVEQIVLFHSSEIGPEGAWNVDEIVETVSTIIPLEDAEKTELKQIGVDAAKDKEELAQGRTNVIIAIMDKVRKTYDKIYDNFDDKKTVHDIERGVLLRAIDTQWIDHLAAMKALRTGIGLRGYGQRDPLVEYKKEGYNMFQALLGNVNHDIAYTFFKYAKHAVDMKVQAELQRSVFQRAGIKLQGAQKTSQGGLRRVPPAILAKALKARAAAAAGGATAAATQNMKKVGRNDDCPCGSKKKFKKCHGA
jgi:preprotein translocase subunit SecA